MESNYIEFEFNDTQVGNETYWEGLASQPTSTAETVAKAFAYSVLFIVSIFGNSSMLWAVRTDPRLKTTTNILIANMAVGDLLLTLNEMLLSIVNIIRGSDSWVIPGQLGIALCKVFQFLSDVSFGVAIYTCVFIAVDRYCAVARPFKRTFSGNRLKYIIAFIWLFPAVISSPVLYTYKTLTESGLQYCIEDLFTPSIFALKLLKAHYICTSLLVTFLPVVLIVSLYVMIVVAMYKHRPPPTSTTQATRRLKQNKKILKMSVTIVTLFCVSWWFAEILALMYKFSNILHDSMPPIAVQNLYFTAVFIIMSSCTHQFFIFLFFVDTYRENFKRIFSRCFGVCCKNGLLRYGSTSVRTFKTTKGASIINAREGAGKN